MPEEPDPDDLANDLGQIYSPEAEDGRTDWPSEIGKATLFFIAALAVLWLVTYCVPVRAAEGQPALTQTRCDTFQDIGDGLYFQDQSIRGTLYGELDARSLISSLIAHTDPALYKPGALDDLRAQTVYVGIFYSRADPHRPAIISFFGADRCRFGYTSINPAVIPVLLSELGTPA